jgi:heparin binding hemagglutinin HbhA
MPAFPKTEDVTKVREQATHALGEAVEQARTPLLAALGAGDLAAQALVEAVNKVRTQLNERAEAARQDLPNDLGELREKFDPAELRKRVDAYSQTAKQLYDYLAERGEETLHRLQDQPRVKKVWDQVGTAQDRVEETVDEVRDLADDVLGKVSRPFGKTEAAKESAKAEAPAKESAAKPAAKSAAKPTTAARTTTTRTTAKPTAAKNGTAKKSSSSKTSEN